MATKNPRAESASDNPLTFTLSPGMAPAAPLLRLLARFDRSKVEAFAEVSIALLDLVDGDADSEGDPNEQDGDERDASWVEWHTLRGPSKRGHNLTAGHEDDEDDDPDHGLDDGEPEFVSVKGVGAGCPIADPGEYEDGF